MSPISRRSSLSLHDSDPSSNTLFYLTNHTLLNHRTAHPHHSLTVSTTHHTLSLDDCHTFLNKLCMPAPQPSCLFHRRRAGACKSTRSPTLTHSCDVCTGPKSSADMTFRDSTPHSFSHLPHLADHVAGDHSVLVSKPSLVQNINPHSLSI